MTAASDPVRPGFRCPALTGDIVDMRLAAFTFVVGIGSADVADQFRAVEVFGFFAEPGDEHDETLLQTACLEAPHGSPITRMACAVSAAPHAVARIDGRLRANIATCPCTPATECPALSERRLLEAIEEAAGSLPSGDRTPWRD
jgi:hypothetical protein